MTCRGRLRGSPARHELLVVHEEKLVVRLPCLAGGNMELLAVEIPIAAKLFLICQLDYVGVWGDGEQVGVVQQM